MAFAPNRCLLLNVIRTTTTECTTETTCQLPETTTTTEEVFSYPIVEIEEPEQEPLVVEVDTEWAEQIETDLLKDDNYRELYFESQIVPGSVCGDEDTQDVERITVPHDCVKMAYEKFCPHADEEGGNWYEGFVGSAVRPDAAARRRGMTWRGPLSSPIVKRDVVCDGFDYKLASTNMLNGDASESCIDGFAKLLEDCGDNDKVTVKAVRGIGTGELMWQIDTTPEPAENDDEGDEGDDGSEDDKGDEENGNGEEDVNEDNDNPDRVTNDKGEQYDAELYKDIPINTSDWTCTKEAVSLYVASVDFCKCASGDIEKTMLNQAGCSGEDDTCGNVSACRPWQIVCRGMFCGGDFKECEECNAF